MVDPLEIGELPPRLVRTRTRPSARNPAPNTLFHFHPWMLPTRIASSPDNRRNCSLLLTPFIHNKHHCKRLCPPKTPRGRPARLDTLTPLVWLEHRKRRLSSPLIVGVKAQQRQQHQHHHHHPTLLILTYHPNIDSTTTTRSAIFPPPNHPRRRVLSCLSLSLPLLHKRSSTFVLPRRPAVRITRSGWQQIYSPLPPSSTTTFYFAPGRASLSCYSLLASHYTPTPDTFLWLASPTAQLRP
jgi:hypothetical protein